MTYNALRSQKTARAEATNYAPWSQKHSVAGDTEFFLLYEEELSGGRRALLVEVRPQDRVKRHTVEHIIDVLSVQILDAPVPQMVDNVMDALRRLDRPIAKQVIAVPKISCSSCPSRAVLREPQTAEQLAKVPTILYFLKQPITSISSTFPFLVVGLLLEVHKVFSQDTGTFKRTAEQIADIPFLVVWPRFPKISSGVRPQLFQQFLRECIFKLFYALFPN